MKKQIRSQRKKKRKKQFSEAFCRTRKDKNKNQLFYSNFVVEIFRIMVGLNKLEEIKKKKIYKGKTKSSSYVERAFDLIYCNQILFYM